MTSLVDRLRATSSKVSIAMRGESSGELVAPPAATVADAVMVGIGIAAAVMIGCGLAAAQALGWLS